MKLRGLRPTMEFGSRGQVQRDRVLAGARQLQAEQQVEGGQLNVFGSDHTVCLTPSAAQSRIKVRSSFPVEFNGNESRKYMRRGWA